MEGHVVPFPSGQKTEGKTVKLLETLLLAARQNQIAHLGVVYVSQEGDIVKGSVGDPQYNTAMIGGLTSLSISLNEQNPKR